MDFRLKSPQMQKMAFKIRIKFGKFRSMVPFVCRMQLNANLKQRRLSDVTMRMTTLF